MSEQTVFWHYVHKLPYAIRRLLCDLCDEFGFDPKTWPPNGTIVGATGPPMPIVCSDCRQVGTHRACDACYWGSGGMSVRE